MHPPGGMYKLLMLQAKWAAMEARAGAREEARVAEGGEASVAEGEEAGEAAAAGREAMGRVGVCCHAAGRPLGRRRGAVRRLQPRASRRAC